MWQVSSGQVHAYITRTTYHTPLKFTNEEDMMFLMRMKQLGIEICKVHKYEYDAAPTKAGKGKGASKCRLLAGPDNRFLICADSCLCM